MLKTISKSVTAAMLAVTFAMPLPASAISLDRIQTTSDVTLVAQQRKEVPEKFKRKVVRLTTDEKPGTIIIDTNNKFLYYVEGNNRATRYGVGVGREGFGWSGVVKIGRKSEWPEWRPPAEMRRREAAK
eukprot:gene35713-40403_t